MTRARLAYEAGDMGEAREDARRVDAGGDHRMERLERRVEKLTEAVEAQAREEGFGMINLDVRETQKAAIYVYESMGYVNWGTHPLYARLADGTIVPGRFYYKVLIGETPELPGRG